MYRRWPHFRHVAGDPRFTPCPDRGPSTGVRPTGPGTGASALAITTAGTRRTSSSLARREDRSRPSGQGRNRGLAGIRSALPTLNRIVAIPDLLPRFSPKLHAERPGGQFLCNFGENHDMRPNLATMCCAPEALGGSPRSGPSRCPRAGARFHREAHDKTPPATRAGPHETSSREPHDETGANSGSTHLRGYRDYSTLRDSNLVFERGLDR